MSQAVRTLGCSPADLAGRRKREKTARRSVMPSNNQNAEQIARDRIDAKLSEAGWLALTQNQICPP